MRSGILIKGESLAGTEIFADLDLKARRAVAGYCTGMEFDASETILTHLDTTQNVYLVLSGVVDVSLVSINGRRITFNEKSAGQMVGELAAIDGRPRCAHVTAKTKCLVASIPPQAFKQIMSANPMAAQRLLERLTSQVRELSERVFEFNALCVNNRIHVELLRCARNATGDGVRRLIIPAPTHADIASRVSTHREAVSREISHLTREGVLEKDKDALVVIDISLLEDLVEQSLGEIPLMC